MSDEFNFDNEMTKHLDSHRAFYAFSQDQYNRNALRCIKYANCGGGLIMPEVNAKSFSIGLSALIDRKIAHRKKSNTKEQIILDELYNYESFLTYEIDDAVDALEIYDYSRADVQAVFDKESKRILRDAD